MTWGTFGPVHIATLILAAAITLSLYFILKNRTEKTQTVVLAILSFSGIAAIIFNLLAWDSPIEYLPFHLCSLNAMVLPFAVITKNKILSNLLLLWSLGAVLAIIVNTAQANYEIFSWTFVLYYFPHTFEFAVVVLLFALKLAKLDVRCSVSTIIVTFVVYTVVHFINLGINAYCIDNNILDYAGNVIQVNYMYSLSPTNPVLELLYSRPYWYMLSTIPIIAVYLLAVYSKQIISLAKRGKAH